MEVSLAQATDQDLLSRRRLQTGTPASNHAAAELLGRYQERIYRWCRRYVREHEQALDLSQDVLLTAFEKLDDLPDETCFGAWIWTVTRNRCFIEIRRSRVREATPVDLDALPANAPDPEEQLLEELDERHFLDLLQRELDPEEQEAISLRCFERLPVDEVTAIMGLSSATGARGLLQRARRKLRAAMDRDRRDERRNARMQP